MCATRVLAVAAAALLAACASVQKPTSLTQAEVILNNIQARGPDSRIEGDLIRARSAVDSARRAVAAKTNQDYVNGLSQIALRRAQTAEANGARYVAQANADSLTRARLARLLTLSEAQRQQLQSQQQLSQAEISALQQRNANVSSQADSLRMRSDSLQRVAEQRGAQLDSALTRLRSLVSEITNLRETTRGIVISLSDILFDVNKATLKTGSEQNIRRIAEILRQYPDNQISVEGHTDATGGDAYNQKLSEDRAASVRASLVAGGVNPAGITSRGFGKTQPVASNATAEGRQANRRVEIVVLGAGKVADAERSRQQGTPAPAGSPPGPGATTSSTTTTTTETVRTPAGGAPASVPGTTPDTTRRTPPR